MPTSLTTFYTNLGDLSITGVTRLFDFPPVALNSADMPAQWVQFPSETEGPMTFGNHGGWPALKAQLIVAVISTIEGTQSANYTAALTMADNVLAALRGVSVSALSLGKARLTWTVNVGIVTVNESDYWAVIADVEGAG
jgi:hypothetical protein